MTRFLLLLTLFFSLPVFSQGDLSLNAEQDTIELKSVDVLTKKPKLKTISFGKLRDTGTDPLSYFSGSYPYYLIEDIPYGTLKGFTFYFYGNNVLSIKEYRGIKHDFITATDYKLSLYEVSSDNKIGKEIAVFPLTIEEHKSDGIRKFNLDVSHLNLTSSRFFVRLEMITKQDCKECFYYYPLLVECEKKLIFHPKKEEIVVRDGIQEIQPILYRRLFVDIKTLTRDY
jgi:hypothetical protein